jgi:putative transferase (TIGR04331 family)
MNRLLVLTRLDLVGQDDVLKTCLGYWVNPCSWSADDIADSLCEFLPDPWNDRKKLFEDYEYLDQLHEKIITKLALQLNQLHRVNYGEKFWRILLDPWLISYLAVLLDRWERLRLAFEKHRQYNVVILSSIISVPRPFFSGKDYLNLTQNDEWNYLLLRDMIFYQYNNNVHYINNEKSQKLIKKSQNILSIKFFFTFSLKNLFLCTVVFFQNLYVFFKNVNHKNPSIYLHLMSLGKLNGIKFNKAIFRDPYYFINFPNYVPYKFKNIKSKNAEKIEDLQIAPSNRFEEYVCDRIIQDLPLEFLDGFKTIQLSISKIPTPKIIVSDNEHWYQNYFKHWLALSQEKGASVILCQHGGSLTQGSLFAMNFEERISKLFLIWSIPLSYNHRQVPPLKYLYTPTRKDSTKGVYISILGFDTQRYVLRCQVNANSSQLFVHYRQVVNFYAGLSGEFKYRVKIRPYPDQGWGLPEKYAQIFGKDKLDLTSTYNQFLEFSKVVVCTYPETTFSDCIARNIPVILLYPAEFWELHSKMKPILKLLVSQKIVFHDAKKAADHINEISRNPSLWWNSIPVKNAINEYKKICLNLNDNSINTWTTFFNGIDF